MCFEVDSGVPLKTIMPRNQISETVSLETTIPDDRIFEYPVGARIIQPFDSSKLDTPTGIKGFVLERKVTVDHNSKKGANARESDVTPYREITYRKGFGAQFKERIDKIHSQKTFVEINEMGPHQTVLTLCSGLPEEPKCGKLKSSPSPGKIERALSELKNLDRMPANYRRPNRKILGIDCKCMGAPERERCLHPVYGIELYTRNIEIIHEAVSLKLEEPAESVFAEPMPTPPSGYTATLEVKIKPQPQGKLPFMGKVPLPFEDHIQKTYRRGRNTRTDFFFKNRNFRDYTLIKNDMMQMHRCSESSHQWVCKNLFSMPITAELQSGMKTFSETLGNQMKQNGTIAKFERPILGVKAQCYKTLISIAEANITICSHPESQQVQLYSENSLQTETATAFDVKIPDETLFVLPAPSEP
jgi:hypothetical protein